MPPLVQGSKAGGHGASPASLLTLIPDLVDHVERVCLKLGIHPAVPVAAAGGITDARQVSSSSASSLITFAVVLVTDV